MLAQLDSLDSPPNVVIPRRTIRRPNASISSRYPKLRGVRNSSLASPTVSPTFGAPDMLVIDNLVFNGWGRRFFDSASVMIPVGTKVGLVGRNGVGKSTLFRLILGDLIPDGGEIVLPKAARIGSVDQEHPATPVSLLDTILAADTEREALNARLETAEPQHVLLIAR